MQKIDLVIRDVELEIESLPSKKEEMELAVSAQMAELSDIKKARQELQLNKKERESSLRSVEEEVQKLRSRSNEVKTNREYQSLTSEIENLNKKVSAIEEDILVLMEKEEDVEVQEKTCSAKTGELEKKFARELESQKSIVIQLNEELEHKKAERKQAEAEVEEESYSIYERLRKNKKDGVAVCLVKDGNCSGCGVTLPTFLTEKVKAKKEFVHCENCSRILF